MDVITKKHKAHIIGNEPDLLIDLLDEGTIVGEPTETVDIRGLSSEELSEKIIEKSREIALENERTKKVLLMTKKYVSGSFDIELLYLV